MTLCTLDSQDARAVFGKQDEPVHASTVYHLFRSTFVEEPPFVCGCGHTPSFEAVLGTCFEALPIALRPLPIE